MKAFKKNELAVYVRYDNKTFNFRRVEVVSCGEKRMTLKDATTGEMLGSDFDPMVGFGSPRYSAEWMAANFANGRPVHHMFRSATFKDMTNVEATELCQKLTAEFNAWEARS